MLEGDRFWSQLPRRTPGKMEFGFWQNGPIFATLCEKHIRNLSVYNIDPMFSGLNPVSLFLKHRRKITDKIFSTIWQLGPVFVILLIASFENAQKQRHRSAVPKFNSLSRKFFHFC